MTDMFRKMDDPDHFNNRRKAASSSASLGRKVSRKVHSMTIVSIWKGHVMTTHTYIRIYKNRDICRNVDRDLLYQQQPQ